MRFASSDLRVTSGDINELYLERIGHWWVGDTFNEKVNKMNVFPCFQWQKIFTKQEMESFELLIPRNVDLIKERCSRVIFLLGSGKSNLF